MIPTQAAEATATQLAPNAQTWRAEAQMWRQETTRQANEIQRLKAEVSRLKQPKPVAVKPAAEPATKTARTFTATAYTAFCDSGCTGVTALGVDVSNTVYYKGHRVVAVDPKVVPLGSTVEITKATGEKLVAKAIDTGGAIRGNRIDLLVRSKERARQFGRQAVQVRILKEAS